MGKGAERKDRDERATIKPAWWPTRVRDLTPAGVDEIVRRTRRVARLMINSASEEVLITDAEIRKHRSIYIRRELIAAKITAWEWFFDPWLGMRPRLSLEEVCPVLHTDPEWIRECVRRTEVGGRPIEPTRYSLPPGYRVAELYHEGDPFPSDRAVAAREKEEAESRAASEKSSLLLPPPPPERLEAARALARTFDEGPKPPALSPEEEIAQVLRLGLDLLGNADAGIVPGSDGD